MPGLVVEGGRYNWVVSLVGLFGIAVGLVLILNVRDAAEQLRDRRARFGRLFGGPVWAYRLAGAFIVACSVMSVLQ